MPNAVVAFAFFAAVWVLGFHVLTRRMVAALTRFDPRGTTRRAPVPPNQMPAVSDLEALGHDLEHSSVISVPGQRSPHICLLRHVDGEVIAEVASRSTRARGRATVSLTSFVGDAVVSTQTTQGMVCMPSERKQVFPGAGVAQLWEEHMRALDDLRQRGAQPRWCAPGSSLSEWVGLIRRLAQEHPRGAVITLRAMAIGFGRTEDAGSILDRAKGRSG